MYQDSTCRAEILWATVAWLVKRYSEARIPETRKIRFWPNVIGRNCNPSPLQLRRKVAAQSSKWTMDNNRRLERSLWCDHWATARLYYRVWMHSRLKSSTSAQKVQHRISLRGRPRGQYGWRWEPSRYGAHYNFGYFSPVMIMGRSMCLRDGLGVGKWMIMLRLCEFSGNVQVLGGPSKSDEAQ